MNPHRGDAAPYSVKATERNPPCRARRKMDREDTPGECPAWDALAGDSGITQNFRGALCSCLLEKPFPRRLGQTP